MEKKTLICVASLFGLERGFGGIQTHIKWLLRYIEEVGIGYKFVSPYNFPHFIVYPVFAIRYLFKKNLKEFSTIWFRYWHYSFLKKVLAALDKRMDISVINCQDPLSALAALK